MSLPNNICYDGVGFTNEFVGVPVLLPGNMNVEFELLNFIMPAGLPQGLWTVNSLFINNETSERGSVSNYNFYYREVIESKKYE